MLSFDFLYDICYVSRERQTGRQIIIIINNIRNARSIDVWSASFNLNKHDRGYVIQH